MNKRQIHHFWTKFRAIKARYFLIAAIACTLLCGFALRANNEHMIKLRNAVYTADQNNTNVQGTLQNLQAYVTSHMNTNLSAGPNAVYPPIQLKYTYDRLVQAESANAANGNTGLYTAAQTYCQELIPTGFSGRYRIQCIEQYIESHSSTPLPAIPDALYKFDFVSPSWSPDLAGWSLLIAIVLWLLTIFTFATNRLLKYFANS